MNKETKQQNNTDTQMGYDTVLAVVSPVTPKNATEALQFYEDTADILPYLQTSEKDNGFDWDKCRAYCKVGKRYSLDKYMEYLAMRFDTTKQDMKNQWRNINYR